MSLLLDTLKDSLDAESAALLQDASTSNSANEYLQSLLINEQLLSTEAFTSNTSASGSGRTLTEEIAELDSRSRQLEVQLAGITNSNRHLIVEVSQDLKTTNQRINIRLEEEITAIIRHVDNLQFRPETASKVRAAEKLAANNAVLFNIDSILDVLELPTLCRLCILQGNYQEALEISTMVRMMIIKYPNLETFRKVDEKIKIELQVMVRGLIKLLNTNLKQSHILKIFQILNRPDLISIANRSETKANPWSSTAAREKSLKIIYLNSRFKFITGESAALKPLLKLKQLTYLKRVIEVYREYLFNSISVYNAIFNSTKIEEDNDEDKFLVRTYVKNLVSMLVAELKANLPASTSDESSDDVDHKAQRDGVILQLIYLCKSLHKYGLDFESILTWELCVSQPAVISREDWTRNLSKVKKFRS